jgi:hypothetical protein
MRKTSVKLLSADGSCVVRWLCVAEAQRLIDKGSARRVSRAKENPIRVQLCEVAKPSASADSSSALTRGDAAFLASLAPGFVERLNTSALRGMSPSSVAALQRLAGWGLLPASTALESFSPEP